MIQVTDNLFVGSLVDFDTLPSPSDYQIILAAHEPCHRKALGYTTKGAPKDSPEYLFAFRNGHQLILNAIDAPDPKYISKPMIDEAVKFGRAALDGGKKLACFCNQGLSRSPTIAMLILAPTLHADFITAEEQFNALYPAYKPGKGMRGFAMENWAHYYGFVSESVPKPAHPSDSLITIESVSAYLKSGVKGDPKALVHFIENATRALDRIANSKEQETMPCSAELSSALSLP